MWHIQSLTITSFPFFEEPRVALISELDFFYISKYNWLVHKILPVSRLGMPKNLEGDTASIADPSWPKDCSLSNDLMSSNERQGKEGGSKRLLELLLLPSPVMIAHGCSRAFSGNGSTSACSWGEVNESLLLLCFFEYLLLCLSSVRLYLNTPFFFYF